MNFRDVATIDYESLPIAGRPDHPPAPVGVAVKVGAGKARYLSWGHVCGKNNSTWEEARRVLGELYDSGRPLLFHNDKFDVCVGEEQMGLKRLPWDRYHDTQPLLALRDPYASTYSLKPSAERILSWEQTERDAVEDWLLKHQPLKYRGVRMSTSKDSPHYVGAYIAFAPAELVGKYAVGDVDRTYGLFEEVHPDVVEKRGMLQAYDRERRLLPVLLDMEREGLRVDLERLEQDVHRYGRVVKAIDQWLTKRLRARGDVNWDSPDQLGAALVRAGVAQLNKTKHGKWEVNKDALMAGIRDVQVLHVLKYRAQLSTCLKTFMRPWLATALASGGFIYTDWMSTRRDKGKGTGGSRTFRIQSTPNFQNLPKEFDPLFVEEITTAWLRENEMTDEEIVALRRRLPKRPIPLPPLPQVRGYVVPYADGEVLIDRDYSQQEPRILAHFEGGPLMEAYLRNPWIDYHEDARVQLERILKRHLKRKVVKGFNLGVMYGMGVGLMAERTGETLENAKTIRNGIMSIYPGLKEMYSDMRERARAEKPVRTWGGGEFYCEPPAIVDGKLKHFDYKMVNALIQRSAGECTKEAMIRFYNAKPKDTRLLLSIHDQLTASCPRAVMAERMELMRQCMESVEFDVPMLSEGAWSATNWNDLEDYDKKGAIVARVRRAA